jgi:phage-related protein
LRSSKRPSTFIRAFEKRTTQTREADMTLARNRLAGFLRARRRKKKEAR